ncbi:MAG TPA: protein-glutamate O-methyltransferase CheR [Bacillota bacterium]|nr:protein-glutamate O-methyltransferase CheR [Bacillota bacterium]
MSEEYATFKSYIKQKFDIDLSLYKEAQMKRRLTSLRNRRGFKNFIDYYKALESDEALANEFMDRITINVSEFYRNPKRWEILQKVIFPRFIHKKRNITIWSAGCSTGEEPYSLALLLKEYFPNLAADIIATDIDNNVLKKAQQGRYQKQALKNLSDYLKKKYFVYEDGFFQIDASLQNMITFKKHNLLADAFPNRIDLIVCRNVLIYFTDEAKSIIYQHLSEALNPNGILFVGSTEQIFNPQQYGLSLVDTFFYQKNAY